MVKFYNTSFIYTNTIKIKQTVWNYCNLKITLVVSPFALNELFNTLAEIANHSKQ
jgi:hypothetical protein